MVVRVRGAWRLYKALQGGLILLVFSSMGITVLQKSNHARDLSTPLGESFALHASRSFFVWIFTNAMVSQIQTVAKIYGSPQPIPNPTSSSNSMISTVETIAIPRKPRPHIQLKNWIMFLNIGLTSYLFITCCL